MKILTNTYNFKFSLNNITKLPHAYATLDELLVNIWRYNSEIVNCNSHFQMIKQISPHLNFIKILLYEAMKTLPKLILSRISQLRSGHVFGPDLQCAGGILYRNICAWRSPAPTIYHYHIECLNNKNPRQIANIPPETFGSCSTGQFILLFGTKAGLFKEAKSPEWVWGCYE